MKLIDIKNQISKIEHIAYKENRDLNKEEIHNIYYLIKNINTIEFLFLNDDIRFKININHILKNSNLLKNNFESRFIIPIISSNKNNNIFKYNNKLFNWLYGQILNNYNFNNFSAIPIYLKYFILYMYNAIYNIENMENIYKDMLMEYITTGRL